MTIRPTAASSTRQPWETTPDTRARKEPDPTGTSHGRRITCARHNYQYDMRSGICFNSTFRNRPLTTYRAWIDHGLLHLATPAEQPQKARIPDARP
jgi:hypothetical protein